MLVDTYDQKGEKVGQTRLPKEIFEVPVNLDLIHQVAISQRANKRISRAHTKTRAEVSGGGRKPWAQKGTGRARHGSIRSPIWRGGGITFGPRKERVFKKKIPKKMKRKALFMVLSVKAKENLLLVLDSLKIEKNKTKLMVKILENLKSKIEGLKEGSILLLLPEYDKDIILASRNIPYIHTAEARNINVLDLLSFKYLLVPKESIKVIKETFLK